MTAAAHLRVIPGGSDASPFGPVRAGVVRQVSPLPRKRTRHVMAVTVADIEAAARNAQPGGIYGPALDAECDDPGCCPDPDPGGEDG
jgi:hypothetical protein